MIYRFPAFLLQETWFKDVSAIWGLVTILFLIAGAAIYLLATGRKEVTQTTRELASSSAELVKIRDAEYLDLKRKYDKQAEELEDVTSEYRAHVGVNLKLLMNYWMCRENEMAYYENLKSQNRVLRMRLGDKGTDEASPPKLEV